MKITIDCALSSQMLGLDASSALSGLLAKAHVRVLDMPLEALVCIQHGLHAQPDYPIAAIGAAADNLQTQDGYWLRADPVHLLLQRDSFSLAEPVPLSVSSAHAQRLLNELNAHFSQDGLAFFAGASGAWYLRTDKIPAIKTSLPAAAVGHNVYRYLPQGEDASVWKAYLNEIQMLLHDHPVNDARAEALSPAVNSIWLSGGGVMPVYEGKAISCDLLVVGSVFYRGLAAWSQTPLRSFENNLPELLQNIQSLRHVRIELPGQHLADDDYFEGLMMAMRHHRIHELQVNLGCHDKTLAINLNRMDLFKFWRRAKPTADYLA